MLFLTACGEAQPQPINPEPPTPDPAVTSVSTAVVAESPASTGMPDTSGNGVGELGSVCHCGERAGGPNCKSAPCKPGLVCGYGCGIPGCDSTCMTPEQAKSSRNIP